MKFLSDKKNLYFTGTYLSLFAFIICSATDRGVGVALFRILAILLFGLFLFKGNSADNKDTIQTVDFEKSVMVLVVLLFNSFMLQRGKVQGEYEVLNIVCSCTLIIMGIVYFVGHHDGISLKRWFSENKLILLLMVCFALLSVEIINLYAMWDAHIYYADLMGVIKRFNADWSRIYNLYLAGHPSFGYTLWVILFQLVRESAETIQIADIVLAVISIYAYYQILRKLLGKKYSNKILTLATMPYVVSPFVMGMVGNINPDSATMYFAIIFIACSLYQYERLEFIFAFLFCFTKEPAVIYYVVYIIAKVICDYFSENKFHLWKLIKFGFGNVKNYVYALPAILWMVLYKLNPSGEWEGVGNGTGEKWNYFGYNKDVIILKLQQIFFLNFNWIFWIAILLGIIILCIKKVKIEKEEIRILVPLIPMIVSLIIFGCVYVTFVLVRYIVLIAPVIYLIVIWLIGKLKSKYISAWSILISILLFIQCFKTVDPVMRHVFPCISIGDEQEICMVGDQQAFDDRMVYNRQSMYWAEVLDKILTASGYNGDMLIVFPKSSILCEHHIVGSWKCAWNVRTRKLENYDEDKIFTGECKEVIACETVSNIYNNLDAVNSNDILYIIPYGMDVDTNFVSNKNIVKQSEIKHKGYNVTYMVMNINLPLKEGNYIVSPKQNNAWALCTDGYNLLLKEDTASINICVAGAKYKFMFNHYQAVMDVQYNRVDENGTVWVYEDNDTSAQRWRLEKTGDYYMICWGDYALTYDLDNNSVRLTPKTGNDNQLWSFN